MEGQFQKRTVWDLFGDLEGCELCRKSYLPIKLLDFGSSSMANESLKS